MSDHLRFSLGLRFLALVLVLSLLSGVANRPILAGENGLSAQPAPPVVTPTPPAPLHAASTTSQDAVWAEWETLSPAVKVKVDGRILDELRGAVLPAHLGTAALPVPKSGVNPAMPRTQTRFIVYLPESADISSLDDRIYASQADRRSVLVDTLRASAASSQAGLLEMLSAASRGREGGAAPVTSFQPFFIINAVAAEADLSTIIALAQRDDVTRIVANYPLYPLVQEVESPVTASGRAALESGTDQSADPAQTEADNRYRWNLLKVEADRVHTQLGIRGAGAVVGGFGTGVNYRHPALLRQYRGNQNGSMDHNYNWFVPDGELYPNGNLGRSVTSEPSDCAFSTHGTHTMGTMVGEGSASNSPIIGMAPDARWIALPGICGDTMPGGIRDDIGGIKAFQWFLCPTDLTGDLASADCSKAPDVINSSWGSANPIDDTFRPILQVLRAAGVAPVFAAGNPSAGPGSIGTPANIPEAITVGATDEYDSLTYFSAQGPSTYPGEQKPELSAPGDYVLSSVGAGGYDTYSGTSMAAPHVAGLIALLVSADLLDGERDFDVEDMERLMELSAVDLGDPGPDTLFGYGRIDAYAAVQLGLTAGDLRGQIFDKEYNQPLASARIEAYQAETGRRFHSLADATGLYSLTLPAGEYQVTLSRWGYETTEVGRQRVVAGALLLNNFQMLSLPQATLSGLVKDEKGPVANALIYAPANPAIQSRSAADGKYQIGLPLGPGELVVEAPGHRILRQSIQTPGVGAQVNFTLKSAPSILLVDTSPLAGWFLGWPVYRFFTRALDEQSYQYDLWRIQYSTFSDTRVGPDGSTLYGLPSAATLKGYDLVMWIQSSCNDADCFINTTAGIGADPALVEYLDSGGRLFISGQDLGVGDGQSVLYDDYLQADLYTSYGGYTGQVVSGVDILSGFQMTITNGSLYGYANGYLNVSPDAVVPQPDGVAFPVLEYAYYSSGAAALAVAPCDATYRAFYLAAGYENLSPRANFTQPDWSKLLDVSIGWLTEDSQDTRYSFSTGTQFKSGVAGNDIRYTFSVANLSKGLMGFAINLEGNRWPTTVLHRDTPLLSPIDLPACSRGIFELRVNLPYSAQLGEQDVFTLTVGSTSHPGLPSYKRRFESRQMPQWAAAEPLLNQLEGMSTFGFDTGYDLVGGWRPYYYDESGLLVNAHSVAEHWRFDPCKAIWESRSPLPEPRSYAASAAIGDRFFVAGGQLVNNDISTITNSLFIYDNTTDTWSSGAPMPRSLIYASGAAVGGKFYLFGGIDDFGASSNFYVYDPATDQWQDMGEMASGLHYGGAAAVVNGVIYLQGGGVGSNFFYSYEPATNLWQQLHQPYWERSGGSLVAAPDGYLYLMGGTFSGLGSLVERYDVATGFWSSVNYAIASDRRYAGAAYAGGKLYLAGGGNASPSHESLRLSGDFCESSLINQQSAVATGGDIVYTLDIRPGDRTYPGAHLTAPLHPGQSFAGFGENGIGASYNSATHAVEWSGALAVNSAPLRLSYAARLNEGVWQVGQRITHTIHLDNRSNQAVTRSTVTQLFAPDFAASTKQVSQHSSATGTPFTYTIALRSRTPVGGEVTIIDPLPSTLEYVAGTLDSGTGTGRYDSDTHSIRWQGMAGVERLGSVNLGADYIWVDTLGDAKAPAPEFVWQDIRSSSTSVLSGSYAVACDLALDFPFPYFGNEYTTVCVDVNGLISFGDYAYPDTYNICPLSNGSNYLPKIAGIWGSFAVDDGVYVQTFGAAPRRYTIFQWADVRPWDYYEDYFGTPRPPDTDFQIVLHEDGRVQIHILRLGATALYRSITGLVSPYAGKSVTYQCNSSNPSLHDRMTVEFLPPGGVLLADSKAIHFQVKAKDDTPINSLITNTVTIQSGQDVYTRSAALLLRSVDLSTSVKIASRTELLPGESVAYTVTLRNQGVAASQQITLSDILPGALLYAPGSLVCSSGSCNASGGLITWAGTLPANGSLSLTYSATLNSVLPDKTALTNTVQIHSTGIADLERSAVVYARSTNLSASLFDFGGRPNEPGDRFTLSALLRNTGLQSTAADFTLRLPAELSYIPGTLRCGVGNCRLDGERILWSGTLPPRGLVAVQMDVRLSSAVVSGQRIRVQGELVDQTFGLTHPVSSEMFVALHLYAPLMIDGRIPPIYLPVVQLIPDPNSPAATPVSPLPTPTSTPPGFPSILVTPTPTPTPAGG